MNTWMYILLLPIIRSLINLNNWYYLRKTLIIHQQFMDGCVSNPTPEKRALSFEAANWITDNMTEIKRCVAKAGVNNPRRSFMEPVGYGHVGQQTVSALDNLLYLNETILSDGRTALQTARGHYFNHAKLSLNPLYWLEILFFLPRELVSASGIEVTSKLADTLLKLFQLIYWLAFILIPIFKPELLQYVSSIISLANP